MDMFSASENDRPPWEEPGQLRRDCEPDRAELLHLLARISVYLGWLSFFGGVTGMLGLPLAIVAWRLTVADLRDMEQGRRDPNGAEPMGPVWTGSQLGIGLNLAGLLAWGALVVLVWLRPLFG